ncbi:helix-turn-helix domain-containing protein [Streptomyces fagopyri]|uniref:helix-turn-helix domain-containing protein n=1 Tax=Streptomyces fagopyri TaxID=2662397 RepID=UPI00380E987C
MERFEGGQSSGEIAAALRVSERSVERWRRAWRERGFDGVLSKGSPGRPRLSEAQIIRLERELACGPPAHGWADQRWTLARIKSLIGRLFHVSYSVEGTWRLMNGFVLEYRPGAACYKAGERSRLIYAIREYRGRKDEPKGFGWRDFRDLIVRAHAQLGGPIVLVWGNVRLHLTSGIREFIVASAEWLTVFQLPTYAPDLNPQGGVWSLVKHDLGNLAAADLGQVTRAVKHRLKQIQYRPDLVDGCLAGTGLILDG